MRGVNHLFVSKTPWSLKERDRNEEKEITITTTKGGRSSPPPTTKAAQKKKQNKYRFRNRKKTYKSMPMFEGIIVQITTEVAAKRLLPFTKDPNGFYHHKGGYKTHAKWQEAIIDHMAEDDFKQYELQMKLLPKVDEEGNKIDYSDYLETYLVETLDEIKHNLHVTHYYNGIKKRETPLIIPHEARWYAFTRQYVKTWRNQAAQILNNKKIESADKQAATRHFHEEKLPQYDKCIRKYTNDKTVNPFLNLPTKKPWTKLKVYRIHPTRISLAKWTKIVLDKNQIPTIYFCEGYIALKLKLPMTKRKRNTPDPKCENIKDNTLGNSAINLPPEIYDLETISACRAKWNGSVLRKYAKCRESVVRSATNKKQ